MNISIIGAGNVGRAFATSARRAGHTVTITAANAAHARQVARDTGATAVDSTADAVRNADVVLLAVPYAAISDVIAEAGEALDGKTVLDATNRPTPDASGNTGPTSIAEELQAQLPDANVVKALNTAFASRQANPVVAGIAVDGYVAGDKTKAKQTALDLLESIGFRPVDAGPLVNARTLEGMAWLNISLNMKGGAWQNGWKLVGPETTVTTSRN
jgi:predicted dinucleotide-binding enzyme